VSEIDKDAFDRWMHAMDIDEFEGLVRTSGEYIERSVAVAAIWAYTGIIQLVLGAMYVFGAPVVWWAALVPVWTLLAGVVVRALAAAAGRLHAILMRGGS
jgi:hypothetical protein